jgi:hypothetical protein
MATQQFQLDMTMMFATHDALRRDLDRAAALSRRTAGWDLFEGMLHFHHTTEDDALWPVVRGEVAGAEGELALLDAMVAEHALIDPLLAAIDEAFGRDDPGRDVGALIGELGTTLRDHLDHEERDALPLIDRTLSLEQWIGFGQAAVQALGPDGPRYFPWLLDGADEETTQRVLGVLPEPVRAACRNEWIPAYEEQDLW